MYKPNIGAMCEFDQNEDTFSVYFDELEYYLPKMVRNNNAMHEKSAVSASRNSFLEFLRCVAAEQKNNNKVSSDSSQFY